jgi:hypothetical protein
MPEIENLKARSKEEERRRFHPTSAEIHEDERELRYLLEGYCQKRSEKEVAPLKIKLRPHVAKELLNSYHWIGCKLVRRRKNLI